MAQVFKLNRNEFDFLIGFVPSYASLNEQQQEVYLRLMSMLQSNAKPKITKFYFPEKVNSEAGNKVVCIKAIRSLTGYGLKEAKEGFEKEERFTLLKVCMTKEAVEALVSTMAPTFSNSHSSIVIIFE